MQYGFLIDHDRCIGCHACTVACKSENDVAVGNFRTWVKYTERGTFPTVKRTFAVLRCNQCTNAPCVTICPVTALSKRKDGIVDLDRDACIGCRACMQACPYDALHLDTDTGSVGKCHYCAHRVEQNLAPACAVVCPTQAIVHGDLHDPASAISRQIAAARTLVRRPEQGTGPNVHYKGVEPLALEPGAPVRLDTYLWSERPGTKPEPWPAELTTTPDARTVLDVGHRVEWGWGVASYLVTKGIGGGAGMLAPLVGLMGLTGFARDWLPELAALLFTGVTTGLLVEDLARPMKFLTLLTRPNTKSWLVRGAWILIGFTLVATAILALRWFGFVAAADALRWVEAPLGAAVAGYTAFLFAQCEGRDLWQSRVVLPHLLLQALACGAALFVPFSLVAGLGAPILPVLPLLGAALLGHAALALYEWRGPHDTTNAQQGAAFLGTVRVGALRALPLSLVVGVVVPLLLLPVVPLWLSVLVPLAVYAGLTLYEWAFVRAGQLPPLS